MLIDETLGLGCACDEEFICGARPRCNLIPKTDSCRLCLQMLDLTRD